MSKVKKVKTKERPNANWIETSTQFVPATGNQSATDAGTAADRLAFDYSVDLQTHSSFNTMEKQKVQATTDPAQPVDIHAPIAPGPEYEVGSPAFQYVPSEPPAVNGNEAGTGGEHPGYVNLNATVV